jgi:hypothetical protein
MLQGGCRREAQALVTSNEINVIKKSIPFSAILTLGFEIFVHAMRQK